MKFTTIAFAGCLFACSLVAAGCGGCGRTVGTFSPCEADADCDANQRCIDTQCAGLCLIDRDCSDGLVCVDGVCGAVVEEDDNIDGPCVQTIDCAVSQWCDPSRSVCSDLPVDWCRVDAQCAGTPAPFCSNRNRGGQNVVGGCAACVEDSDCGDGTCDGLNCTGGTGDGCRANASPDANGTCACDAGFTDDGAGRCVVNGGGVGEGEGEGEGEEPCLEFNLEATDRFLPVDIVLVIDGSPSMQREAAQVNQNLNALATRIAESGLDYRVIVVGNDRELIGLTDHNAPKDFRFPICINAPLGGGSGCTYNANNSTIINSTTGLPAGGVDVDSARYLHVRQPVHSGEPLGKLRSTFVNAPDFVVSGRDAFGGDPPPIPVNDWGTFLRPNSVVHFIAVADDNDNTSAATFTTWADTTAGLVGRWKLHSIVDLTGGTCDGNVRGSVYQTLSTQTGGRQLSICAADWGPLMDAIGDQVAVDATVPCQFNVPNPGDEYLVDFDAVSIGIVDNGVSTPVTRVENAAACTADGWYLDDPLSPTAIFLCPDSCIAARPAERMDVELGCVRLKPGDVGT